MNSAAPFFVAAPNIAELADMDINILVDFHIFGEESQICTGPLEYHYVTVGNHASAYWQCSRCSAVVRSGDQVTPTTRHQRLVPNYCADMATAWRVVERIKALDAVVQARFEMAMMPKYRGNIRNVTPRHIAVAALQAGDVADMQGYLNRKHEVAQ